MLLLVLLLAATSACVYIIDVQQGDAVFFSATNIYLAPTTLSAITFNFLMSLAGGMMAGYIVSKGNAFWTYSSGLAGIIAASAGNDLYHPVQAMLIGAAGVVFMYNMHHWVEKRFKIDDAVSAVAVHGYAGFFGVCIADFMLWGYPSSPNADYAVITPWGQLAGAIIMFWVLGFAPAFLVAKLLAKLNVLRIPPQIELLGLDISLEIEAEEAAKGVIGAERDKAREIGIN